jgi:hypothetical protein
MLYSVGLQYFGSAKARIVGGILELIFGTIYQEVKKLSFELAFFKSGFKC